MESKGTLVKWLLYNGHPNFCGPDMVAQKIQTASYYWHLVFFTSLPNWQQQCIETTTRKKIISLYFFGPLAPPPHTRDFTKNYRHEIKQSKTSFSSNSSWPSCTLCFFFPLLIFYMLGIYKVQLQLKSTCIYDCKETYNSEERFP